MNWQATAIIVAAVLISICACVWLYVHFTVHGG